MPPRRAGRLLVLLLLCTALAIIPPDARAQAQDLAPVWQPLQGPGGRIVHLSGAADGRLLYAVSTTGVHRQEDHTQWWDSGIPRTSHALYMSTDSGLTWHSATNDLPPGAIDALYVEPSGRMVYVAGHSPGDALTRRHGLWRSFDQGEHWEQVPLGRDDLLVRRIARDADGGRLLLGVVEARDGATSYICLSRDDGSTWTLSQIARPDRPAPDTLVDLIPHPGDADRLFVTTSAADLLVSTDAGQTWALADGGESTEGSGAVQLAVSPGEPNNLLLVRGPSDAGEANPSVRRSTNGGLTWRSVSASGLTRTGAPRSLHALAQRSFLLNTFTGSFRSSDNGLSWQPLEGALSSGSVSAFESTPEGAILAATGYGIFVSRDEGAVWQPLGSGLPHNSRIAGVLVSPERPGHVFAISDNRTLWGSAGAPPAVLHSMDGGQRWAPAAQGLPAEPITAWALDPEDPDTLLLASYGHFCRSSDGGVSWQVSTLPHSPRTGIAVAPSAPNRVYLGGQPPLRSSDGGASWQEMPIAGGEQEGTSGASGIAIDPSNPDHVWAGTSRGVYESRDGGATWRSLGLDGGSVRWLLATPLTSEEDGRPVRYELYAGLEADGIRRWRGNGPEWEDISAGIPESSTILAFVADPRDGSLWATRDGGGVYHSADRGASWTNVAASLGDNLATALAINYSKPESMIIGTATAGVWTLTAALAPTPQEQAISPALAAAQAAGVDARIEIVWPHDWASVEQATLANIGIRLFMPRSLSTPPCAWRPKVTVWQAVDANPAEPLRQADMRAVDGQPFPYWAANDVDVSSAADPSRKLYFLVRVEGVDTATSVWAHGADPRTYMPQQDVPSGIATGDIEGVDARIQIVWPHDRSGSELPVAEAPLANVAVAFFMHGTRLSAPTTWEPADLVLYGAWNQETGRPIARSATRSLRQAGAITYPIWEFDNVPVARAADPANRLYLWVEAADVFTYPTIWAHGADSRTFFPAEDEPIMGCLP